MLHVYVIAMLQVMLQRCTCGCAAAVATDAAAWARVSVVDQVTTIRSSVKKPDIPLMTDPVSKIQAIGKDTVARLKDLTAAAAASSDTRDSGVLQDFCSQCNSITTGKFLKPFVT